MSFSKESEAKEKRRFIYIAGLAGQVTFMLVGPVVLSLFLGFWLDKIFHTSPLFIILGVFLGFIGSIFNVFKIMKMVDKM